MNYRTPEETFRFSEQTQAVYQDLLHRIQPNRVREMTITGPESDGKTPMIDVFEETRGEAFPVRVAKSIVRSWIESPVILYPGEKVVGVPRPQRVDSEHFSWGIMYHPEYLGAEAYKNKKQQTIRRYEAIAEEMSPGPWECIGKKQEALFGSKEAVTAANRGLWYTGGYQGHTVPSYQKLLNLGLPGLSEEIKTYRKINTGKEAQDLYDACDILIAGLKQWMLQYAEEAEQQAKAAATPEDKARLLKIADTCKNLTEHPPEPLPRQYS